jgi:hypothetical protein
MFGICFVLKRQAQGQNRPRRYAAQCGYLPLVIDQTVKDAPDKPFEDAGCNFWPTSIMMFSIGVASA